MLSKKYPEQPSLQPKAIKSDLRFPCWIRIPNLKDLEKVLQHFVTPLLRLRIERKKESATLFIKVKEEHCQAIRDLFKRMHITVGYAWETPTKTELLKRRFGRDKRE